jgi:hypothetical protein
MAKDFRLKAAEVPLPGEAAGFYKISFGNSGRRFSRSHTYFNYGKLR